MNKTYWRQLKDRFAGRLTGALTIFAAALILLIALALLVRAQPLLDITPLGELLTSSDWHPLRGAFGFLPFIVGTLWVTALAMVLAVPPCLLCAIVTLQQMLNAEPPVDSLDAARVTMIPGTVWGQVGRIRQPVVGDPEIAPQRFGQGQVRSAVRISYDLPSLALGVGGQFIVRVDCHRMTHPIQQGQVRIAVCIGVTMGQGDRVTFQVSL